MGAPRSGREDGKLGDQKEVGSEEHQNDLGGVGTVVPGIKAAHAGL